MTEAISHDHLRMALNYDPETGVFTWKTKTGPRVIVGRQAGRHCRKGYLRIKISGRLYAAHRLAWFYMKGEWPEQLIDHINRVRDDNRFENLRPATLQQNTANSVYAKRKEAATRQAMKGAYFRKPGKWESYIVANKKRHFLGCFRTQEEAHAAYMGAARVLFGPFARGAE